MISGQDNMFMVFQSEWKKAEMNSCHSKWYHGNSGSEKTWKIVFEQLLESDTCVYGRLNRTDFSDTGRVGLWLLYVGDDINFPLFIDLYKITCTLEEVYQSWKIQYCL